MYFNGNIIWDNRNESLSLDSKNAAINILVVCGLLELQFSSALFRSAESLLSRQYGSVILF